MSRDRPRVSSKVPSSAAFLTDRLGRDRSVNSKLVAPRQGGQKRRFIPLPLWAVHLRTASILARFQAFFTRARLGINPVEKTAVGPISRWPRSGSARWCAYPPAPESPPTSAILTPLLSHQAAVRIRDRPTANHPALVARCPAWQTLQNINLRWEAIRAYDYTRSGWFQSLACSSSESTLTADECSHLQSSFSRLSSLPSASPS